jgi:hypothetical protein
LQRFFERRVQREVELGVEHIGVFVRPDLRRFDGDRVGSGERRDKSERNGARRRARRASDPPVLRRGSSEG